MESRNKYVCLWSTDLWQMCTDYSLRIGLSSWQMMLASNSIATCWNVNLDPYFNLRIKTILEQIKGMGTRSKSMERTFRRKHRDKFYDLPIHGIKTMNDKSQNAWIGLGFTLFQIHGHIIFSCCYIHKFVCLHKYDLLSWYNVTCTYVFIDWSLIIGNQYALLWRDSLSQPQHPLVTCRSLSRVEVSWAFLHPQTSFLGCNCRKIYFGESCTHLCIYWRLGCSINLHKRIVLAPLQNWISIWYRIHASLRARSM